MAFALILNGTIVQISDNQFPVASGLIWVDISNIAPSPTTGWTAEKSSSGVWSFTSPVAAVVPLKTQAQRAQIWISQQAALATAMGEVFTADMKAYVLAINAIASGTDTTSTALPTQPTDVMAAAGTTTTTSATS